MNEFQKEWAILHGDIEQYERFSLGIKLVAVLVGLLANAYLVDARFTVVLLLVLWLQDGIWKTFQHRLQTRIGFVEQTLRNEGGATFQLYSQWEAVRPGIAGLLKEYLSSAARPTVAYPYVILVLLVPIFS